jgi:iron(III) transport system permease protein
VAPLAVPAFVHSYAWMTSAPGMHGLTAGVMVSVIAYFPFLYLPVAAALRRLDPGMEDSAASLGLSPWAGLLSCVLPQLRLAVCGGSLLVGLHLLAEYGLYAMIRFDTFTTAIVDQFQSTYNGPAANMLAGVLVVCCFALLGLESAARARSATRGRLRRAARMPFKRKLGASRACACCCRSLLAACWRSACRCSRWGAGWWRAVRLCGVSMSSAPRFFRRWRWRWPAALLTTVAAVPMAWLSIRSPGRLQRVLEGCNYMVGSLPGVVVALALVTVTVRLPIYQTVADRAAGLCC